MTGIALATTGMLVALNGVGLAVSLWLDRKGIPVVVNGQAARRKPDSLRPRLPLIFANLAMLIGGAFVALSIPAVADVFTFAAPPWWLAVFQVALLMAVDDLWFYGVHRLLHEHKGLYKRIHKVHHKAFAPVPIEYLYVHPFEWMAGALGPVATIVSIGVLTGEINAWVFLFWSGLRTTHELDIHSGVRSWLSKQFPLLAPTEHHDLHHAKPTLGNYASTFRLWDALLGTEIRPAAPTSAK